MFFEGTKAPDPNTLESSAEKFASSQETFKDLSQAIKPELINAHEITGKSGLKTITLPFSELGGAELSGGYVRINRIGKHLAAFNTSTTNQDNAICLLFIVNSLVAGNAKEAAAAPAETPAE